MLRIILSIASFIVGIVILYYLRKWNKDLKNSDFRKDIDEKTLYSINVVSICIALFFCMVPLIIYFS